MARPMIRDASFAAALFAVGYLTPGPAEDFGFELPLWGRSLALLCSTVPLVWRRRFPLTVLQVVLVPSVLTSSYLLVAATAMLVIYTAVAHARRRWHLFIVAGYVALMLTPFVLSFREDGQDSFVTVFLMLLVLAPVWLGATMRTARRRHAELELREAQLRAERADNARRTVFEEQVRIARELHDVVAHHVGMMGIHAAAARRDLDTNPASAVRELAAIESSSRHAVTELYAMLGHLRRRDEPAEPLPQPGIAQVDELVERIRQADLIIVGEPRAVPRTVDISVYRIVQEALTNAVKHAGGAAVHVVLDHRPESVAVTVIDEGAGRADPPGVGYGLVGMRERVALHGGQLEAGPLAEGGFRVHAELPTNSDEPQLTGSPSSQVAPFAGTASSTR
ncbi:sensor histidine kinase [Pseudonocardia sp. TRM90224]|uniref:sensor histidine kinase n=1 Tax=Pseudonocardia sp. TRM90224 TaxID=2812678 RepID=UPI003F912D27